MTEAVINGSCGRIGTGETIQGVPLFEQELRFCGRLVTWCNPTF